MKKLSVFVAVILALSVLAGCGAAASSSAPVSSAPAHVEGELTDLMAKLYENLEEGTVPAVMDMEVNADTVQYHLGLTMDDFKEALVSDAMISAIPHSVALIRAESAEKAAELAETLAANETLRRKWICVEAETVITDNIGDLVVLIMTNEDAANKIHENFLALAA